MFDIAQETVGKGAHDTGEGDGEGDAFVLAATLELLVEAGEYLWRFVFPDYTHDQRLGLFHKAQIVQDQVRCPFAGARELQVRLLGLDEAGIVGLLAAGYDGQQQFQFDRGDILFGFRYSK